MSEFLQEHGQILSQFAALSQSIGARADYVQGGGGNTSVKLPGGRMAIKASGYCLSDITQESAFAVLDYEVLREFYGAHRPEDFEDVEKAGAAVVKTAVREIQGMPSLRPSVEAGFHALLDTFVAHSHSVYANLASCAREGRQIAAKALAGADYKWGFVNYTDPGARLTFSIQEELARVEKEEGKRPAVIFMANHGIIVHHQEPDVCLSIHADVNARMAAAFGLAPDAFPAVALAKAKGMLVSDTPYLKSRLKTGVYTQRFFLEEPLYPDQQVFLTDTFSFSGEPKEDCCTASVQSGLVRYNMAEKKALVIEQTLTAVVFIVENIRANAYNLCTMGSAAKAFIANWESEKYRKAMAAKPPNA